MLLHIVIFFILDTVGFVSYGFLTISLAHTLSNSLTLTLIAVCGKLMHYIETYGAKKDTSEDGVTSGRLVLEALA